MGVRRLQLVGLHRHAGDEGRDVVGRAAEQAVGEIGDAAMAFHTPLQVVPRARAQEIDRVPAPILLVGQRVAVGRVGLEIVEAGHGRRGVAKRRMGRDVVDALAADIDGTAVAQRFEMLFSRTQHDAMTIFELLRRRPCVRLAMTGFSAGVPRLSQGRSGICE